MGVVEHPRAILCPSGFLLGDQLELWLPFFLANSKLVDLVVAFIHCRLQTELQIEFQKMVLPLVFVQHPKDNCLSPPVGRERERGTCLLHQIIMVSSSSPHCASTTQTLSAL